MIALNRLRALAGAFITVALATGLLAACGGDDDDAQSLTFKVNGTKVTGPDSAEAGTAEITVENTGEETSDLQLLRVEGDRSAAELAKALGARLGRAEAPFPIGSSPRVASVLPPPARARS